PRLHYRLVPAGGENRPHHGLADIAAQLALAVAGEQLLEPGDALDANDAVQLLAGMAEVLAQATVHHHAAGTQLVLEHLFQQGTAAAAAGARSGRRLELAQVGHAGIHLAADRALADVVAGPGGCRVRP